MTAWAGSNRKAELPPDWPVRRLAVFERDGWTCVQCGHHDPTCATLECDHMGAKTDHRLHMLRTLCADVRKGGNGCHRQHTAQQGANAKPRTHRRAEPHPGLH